MKLFKNALNYLIPCRCLGCQQILYEGQQICPTCWLQIDFISHPCCQICHLPFEFDNVLADLCQYCADTKPPFVQAAAAFTYGGLGAGLILRLKHTDHIHLAKMLARWMVNHAGPMINQCDILVPVPIHWCRLVSRRYNQAAVLCHAVSKLTSIATRSQVLKRIKSTPPQGHMNRSERQANVKGAFKINQQVRGQSIMLIDDVFTSGATINECCEVLLNNGAKAVYVLTAAKVKYS